jgi:hypothetical protein
MKALKVLLPSITGGHSSTCVNRIEFLNFDVFNTTVTTTDACTESQDVRVYISKSIYTYFISFESREARFISFLLGSESL